MKMRNFLLTKFYRTFFLLVTISISDVSFSQKSIDNDSILLRKTFDEALVNGKVESNLKYLTSEIGARISGSKNAQKAVEWAKRIMKEVGPDTVYLQEVMVPHWVRGAKEQALFSLSDGSQTQMDVCALGRSIGTKGFLKAEVVEVKSWKELEAININDLKGKFVFFNRAMDPKEVETFEAYIRAVDQRTYGAIEASKKGAVGALVRSLTLSQDDVPHTGALNYDLGVKKIPAAALSTNSADRLSDALERNPDLVFSLKMNCKQLPDVLSYNVIGEIKGEKFPNEIVSIGGHLDSWDLSESASDNGTGVVQTIEALRLIKKNMPNPNRTFRAILYMNEESGAHGAKKYASLANSARESHIAVMESDAGGFTPRGFRVKASPQVTSKITTWIDLFKPYKVDRIVQGHRGVDLVPMKSLSKALISLDLDDQRLFDIHHSRLDTFDKINMREVKLGAASMTSLAMLILKYGL
jgi:carboxypeptidase Q